ncbi:unnamed protein product [Urochloa humidicola]
MMARVCVLNDDEQDTPRTRMVLDETRAQVHLGEDGDESGRNEKKLWYLDSGASNHMTEEREAFSELDTGVVGTVKFGDGSRVEIRGRGTIVFMCKNGEHRALTDVYFIPKLQSNIISIGQLDERGCQVLIDDGMLRIRDRDN